MVSVMTICCSQLHHIQFGRICLAWEFVAASYTVIFKGEWSCAHTCTFESHNTAITYRIQFGRICLCDENFLQPVILWFSKVNAWGCAHTLSRAIIVTAITHRIQFGRIYLGDENLLQPTVLWFSMVNGVVPIHFGEPQLYSYYTSYQVWKNLSRWWEFVAASCTVIF